MKIIFTLCGNNYLAQAKTLADSARKHNPDYHFVIGLVDGLNDEVNYDDFAPTEILDVSTIDIPKFEDMHQQYDIVEFSTSVKPFYFLHFLRAPISAEMVIYLDPDTMVFDSFEKIESEIKNNSILLTPHSLTPIPRDGKWPQDNLFLNAGVYNLGFLAVRNVPSAIEFIEWWASCLESMGYLNYAQGLFVDQLWVNLAPLYFKGAKISSDPGLNMAYWNFHERQLSQVGGSYVVNDSSPLTFFHFSSYNPLEPLLISRQQVTFSDYRSSFEDRQDLRGIYDLYRKKMLENKYELYSQLPWGIENNATLSEHQVEAQASDRSNIGARVIRRIMPTWGRRKLRRLLKKLARRYG